MNELKRSPMMYENEARKCIVVCANCHREIHAGVVDGLDGSYKTIRELEELPLLQLIDGGVA